MTDLTRYSENELSLLVFNTEELYKARHRPKYLAMLLNRFYAYSLEQLEVLNEDIANDLNEQ